MNAGERHSLDLSVGLLLLAAALFQPGALPARSLLEAGSGTVWKYLDTGSDPGPEWRQPGFDDSKWKSGPAPLGYGEARLGTKVESGADKTHKPITTWFRREFSPPELQSGENLVILICMDDGAIIYVNGQEVGRANVPKGPISAATVAVREMPDGREGFYYRLPLSPAALRPGQKNVIAVEVHQASAASDDLFFDLALKTLRPKEAAPKVMPQTRDVLDAYYKHHYIGPGTNIPDGFIDGGRYMQLDAEGRARSAREILLVDRPHDPELSKELEFARSRELRQLPPLERTQRLAAYVDHATTPPGGIRLVGPTVDQITREFANRPLRIGDVVEQSQAGVCRHRSLLFKLLADEAGLKAALVRGNYAAKGPRGFAHAWNEVTLDDGRRVLVDVMHHGGKAKFHEVNSPDVIARYLRENDTPWYGPKASPTTPPVTSAPATGQPAR